MSATASSSLPIVKLAAGAVIVLCGVGVGVMTGLIPSVSSVDKPAAEIKAPAEPAAAVSKTVERVPSRPQRAAHAPIQQAKATPVCADCGVVESIDAVEVKGQATGAGAVAGAVGGLIVGNQIGKGRGKTLAKVVGAVGGAYAGNEIEKNARKTNQYQVAVRMEDGTVRTLTQASGDGLSPGAKVRIIDGVAVPN